MIAAAAGQAAAEAVLTGPLLIAAGFALAAGVVSFLSPCCLPLVPAYMSYVAGVSDTGEVKSDGVRHPGRHVVGGTILFVLGFAAVFTSYGAAFGGIGGLLLTHRDLITRILGVVTIVLGLVFAGVVTRVPALSRTVRPAWRPRAGLAGAPALGVLFGVGWTPCIGPTLAAVLTLATDSSAASRGALLAFVYSVGLGLPFIAVAAGFVRATAVVAALRRHTALVAQIGGALMVVLGLLQVSGAWTALMANLQGSIAGFQPAL